VELLFLHRTAVDKKGMDTYSISVIREEGSDKCRLVCEALEIDIEAEIDTYDVPDILKFREAKELLVSRLRERMRTEKNKAELDRMRLAWRDHAEDVMNCILVDAWDDVPMVEDLQQRKVIKAEVHLKGDNELGDDDLSLQEKIIESILCWEWRNDYYWRRSLHGRSILAANVFYDQSYRWTSLHSAMITLRGILRGKPIQEVMGVYLAMFDDPCPNLLQMMYEAEHGPASINEDLRAAIKSTIEQTQRVRIRNDGEKKAKRERRRYRSKK
jgi:hypothetical protein